MQLVKFAAQNPAATRALTEQIVAAAMAASGPISRAMSNRAKRNAPNTRQPQKGSSNGKFNRQLTIQDYMPPQAINMPMYRRTPKFNGRSEGNIVISNTELLTTLTFPTGLTTNVRTVQPGIASMFPWASAIASNFEKYKIISLSFRYKPSVPTSTAGAIVMAFAVDPTTINADVATIQEISQYPQYIDNSVFSPYELKIESKYLNHELFVRHGNVPSTDIKTYDAGAFIFAVDGLAATTNIGRMYVDYQIMLQTPKSQFCPGADLLLTSGLTSANLFGAAGSSLNFTGTDITIDNLTNSFRVNWRGTGSWYMVMSINSVGDGNVTFTNTANTTVTPFTLARDNGNATKIFRFYVNASDFNSSTTFTTATAFGVVSASRIILTPQPETTLPPN